MKTYEDNKRTEIKHLVFFNPFGILHPISMVTIPRHGAWAGVACVAGACNARGVSWATLYSYGPRNRL